MNFNLKNQMPKEVENFKKIIKGKLKDYIDRDYNSMEEMDQKDVVTKALYAGYLDTCRTINWKGQTDENRQFIVEQIFKDSVVDRIAKCMKEENSGETENEKRKNFDMMHHELCEKMIKAFSKEIMITYGQAQKIINMAFKYLYCFQSIDRKYFKNCHMPLDSFTLEWLYRACLRGEKIEGLEKNLSVRGQGKYVKKDAIGTWSSIKYDTEENKDKCTYLFYLKLLRQKFVNECLLEMDFYIWPRIQKILATEAFIKTFKDDNKGQFNDSTEEKNEDYQINKLENTLQNKLHIVKNIMDS